MPNALLRMPLGIGDASPVVIVRETDWEDTHPLALWKLVWALWVPGLRSAKELYPPLGTGPGNDLSDHTVR